MKRGKDLQVPGRRLVGVLKVLGGEERERRSVKAGGHEDHVSRDFFFTARPVLRNAGRAMVEEYAMLRKADDIASQPGCFTSTDLMEDVRVYHWGSGEQALRGGRGEIGEVAVEEQAEE